MGPAETTARFMTNAFPGLSAHKPDINTGPYGTQKTAEVQNLNGKRVAT